MRIVGLGLLFLTSCQVNAESPSEYNAMYDKCVGEAGASINNSVVFECTGIVSEKAKSEIVRHYKSIYDKLLADGRPEDAKKFEMSQKAWIQYRNSYCDFQGAYIGPPMYGVCPMNLNSDKAIELREFDQ